MEIDKKDKLIRKGQIVIDLGAAPGSWSQVTLEKIGPDGRVVAVDLQPIKPLRGLKCIQGDFLSKDVREAVEQAVEKRPIDLVLSDMCPNITGVRHCDQARSIELAQAARDFALSILRPGGQLVLKMFEGIESKAFQRTTETLFGTCVVRKPASSRSKSSEFFLVARNSVKCGANDG